MNLRIKLVIFVAVGAAADVSLCDTARNNSDQVHFKHMHAPLLPLQSRIASAYANPAHGNRISNIPTHITCKTSFKTTFLSFFPFVRSFHSAERFAFNQFTKNVINKMTFYYG